MRIQSNQNLFHIVIFEINEIDNIIICEYDADIVPSIGDIIYNNITAADILNNTAIKYIVRHRQIMTNCSDEIFIFVDKSIN